MKWVRVKDGAVVEVIPEAAAKPGVAYWYGEKFASECVEVCGDAEQNWVFSEETGGFMKPPNITIEKKPLSLEERVAALEKAVKLLQSK